ncbi:MAG: methylmalonyl Co-A mutase-associated GTPase MeaB [Planctomycetes bacterium]|nr:methylmalonyl Co-A mutase-associated GTPase MeaB [Planctomycetota bacterium]
MIAGLLERLRHGDRNALARLLSITARGEQLADIQSALAIPCEPSPVRGRSPSRVVAFTGSGGVGKSTLIGKLINLVRNLGRKVAVLACDPQSPLSGGALLGDRFRMGSSTDDGVFIRSLAAQTGHGAIADHLDVMIRLLETFGFDAIFLETVGAGQGDVEVRNLADVVVLMLQPESGDDVQWEKAGILECADVIVVHKSDMPTAEQTAAQVRAALDLSMGRSVPVLRVSTKANQGHAELWQAIEALPLRRRPASAALLLFQMAVDTLRQRFENRQQDAELRKLVEAWQRGEVSTASAVETLVRSLES